MRMIAQPGAPVYPRVCGGTLRAACSDPIRRGLSPRVRGNLRSPVRPPLRAGSIPACAGEPVRDKIRPYPATVYPRVCGGTRGAHPQKKPPGGLSPRVRGNRPRGDSPLWTTRSIPACAGEPSAMTRAPAWAEVYPRVCGGTGHIAGWWQGWQGLSPRVRGNPIADRPAQR